jgi:undecaprenyl-diphosphatase
VAWRAGYPIPRAVLLVTGCVWASDLTASLVKLAVGRERPFESISEADPLMGSVGSSFPSGHAATSAAGAFALALIAPRAAPYLAALAGTIAFSRVYVGVHYPFDVLAGLAVGLAVAGVILGAVRLLRPTSEAPPRSAAPPRQG